MSSDHVVGLIVFANRDPKDIEITLFYGIEDAKKWLLDLTELVDERDFTRKIKKWIKKGNIFDDLNLESGDMHVSLRQVDFEG